jgi:hypothetical protein
MKRSGPRISETIPSGEKPKTAARFVVYGTRSDGIADIAEELRGAIEKVPGSRVDAVLDISGIEDMFYGRYGDPKETMHYEGSRIGRLGAVVLGRKRRINGATQTPVRTTGPDTLPQAVVVLPEMRLHDPYSGAGLTITTPVEAIASLCGMHGVPMIRVDAQPSAEQLAQLAETLTVV